MTHDRSDQTRAAISPGRAIHRLLEEIARLCALARVSEEAAVAILRSGYRQQTISSHADRETLVDLFTASQVLSEWHENARFLTHEGLPSELSVASGGFSALCRAATVDSDASEVLELLLQAGAVNRHGDFVAATRRELIVGDNQSGAVTRAVGMASDLVSTLNHNLTRTVGEPGRFERSVANNRMSLRQMPALLAYLSLHGQSFLEDLDSWMAERTSNAPLATIGVGVYLFVEPSYGGIEQSLPRSPLRQTE